MHERLFIAALAVLTVVSSVSLVATTPRVLAAHRAHQRLEPKVQPREVITSRFVQPIFEKARRARVVAPLRAVVDARRRRGIDRRIPDSMDRVVRQLRSGATLSLALRHVGEVDPVFSRITREIAERRSLQDAIDVWRSEDDLPNRKLAATALELASSAGGASAQVLDGVAASLRDRVALEREVSALSSQSKASAVVLVIAPLVFAALTAAFDDRIFDVLVGRPVGWACLGLGLGLDGIGALWMARLIGRHR